MDLFDYAQELFNEQGELWVPGLGYFSKVRKNSHYDADTLTMFPPRYEGSFEEHPDNTDASFVAYFSRSKNLSQGSSKYFVDKFVENIKAQLQERDVAFGSLGTLYTLPEGHIGFRGNELSPSSEGALYGLAPVTLSKLAPAAAFETSGDIVTDTPAQIPATPETELTDIHDETAALTAVEDPAEQPAGTDEEATVAEQQPRRYDPNNFYTDDRVLVLKGKPQQAEQSNRYQFWILAGLVGLVVIAGIYLLTQNYLAPGPDSTSNDVSNQILSHNAGRTDTAINISKAKADSQLVHSQDINPLPTTVDTSGVESALGSSPNIPGKTTTPAPADASVPKGSWLVAGGQNANYNAAVKLVDKYRGMGYAEARLLDSVKKPDYFVYKVIFGYYNTSAQANAARTVLLEEKKLKPQAITVQKYK